MRDYPLDSDLCTKLRWVAYPERLTQLRWVESRPGLPLGMMTEAQKLYLVSNGFAEPHEAGLRLSGAGRAIMAAVDELVREPREASA